MDMKVDTEMLEKIDGLELSPRAVKIKEQYFNEKIQFIVDSSLFNVCGWMFFWKLF